MSDVMKSLADVVVGVCNQEDTVERLRAELASSREEHLKTQVELKKWTKWALDAMDAAVESYEDASDARNLLRHLFSILMRYCGETGESEGAVETLERLIEERDSAGDVVVEQDEVLTIVKKMLGASTKAQMFGRIASLLIKEDEIGPKPVVGLRSGLGYQLANSPCVYPSSSFLFPCSGY